MKKRKNGMTSKGVIKCREQFDSLLAQGRQVTSDTTEHCHPNFRKEKGGGLLLDAGSCADLSPPGCCQMGQQNRAGTALQPICSGRADQADCEQDCVKEWDR